MAAAVFTSGAVAMARIPLVPTSPTGGQTSDGLLTEGVFLASRSLDNADPKAQRTVVARTAYELRARTRTTPHGVWCAVAAADIDGQETVLRLGDGHRTVTVPSPRWLHAVADRHLDTPATQQELTLAANNIVVRRGTRLEAEHPGPAGTGQLGSVAATDLSVWLLKRCAVPTPAAEVISDIQARYPGATVADAQTALAQMIRTGLLLTDLLPDDLRGDPLGHLAQRIPAGHPDHASLCRLRELLHQADDQPIGTGARLGLLRCARDVADELHYVDRPFTVDTLADADLRLPAGIARRAAETASVLWRVGHRSEPLRAWTGRFGDAYGRHRMVPLLEAVDPAVGIGPPGPEDSIAAAAELNGRRSRYLSGLLTEALAQGRSSISLTDEHIRHLEYGEGLPPATAEIHLHVAAPGSDGPPLLTVVPQASQDAGSAAGRFARWLPQLLDTAVVAGSAGEPVRAEIVCRPRTVRTAALAPETGACSYRIPIGVPVRPGDLDTADLAVAFTGSRLVLWSHQLNRPVTPVLFSRITRDLLPPVARLLHLLGHAGERPWHPWSWGPASFPYTPRVTYRDVVLAPQRWTLPDDLVAASTQRTTWHVRLNHWLTGTRPRVPTRVVAEESDRHLLLDLTDTDQQEILRRTVAAGSRTVAEPLGYAYDELPVEGRSGRHPLELVIPLRRRTTPPPPALDPRIALRLRSSDTVGPAQGWLSAALAIPARHQDEALRQLPSAANARLFYWLRYRTPALGPHLRLRFHADPATPDALVGIQHLLANWAQDLANQRLSDGLLHFEPYVRETQRYGGPDAIDHAESFFAADSAFARAALHLGDTERHVLAAHSAAAIALTARTPAAIRGGPLTTAERRRRDELRTRTRIRPVPPETDPLQQARHTALTALTQHLTSPGKPHTVSDLIHLHCNRLLGTDPGAERITRSLATDLIHRHG